MKRIFWVILICISGYLFLIRTHFMVNASLSTPTLSEEEPELTTSGSCPSGNVWSITDFGANGSDNLDDYAALLKAAKCASNKENITLYFPAGHYYIKKYRITGATSDGRQPNGINHIVYNNCKGLRIIGAGKDKTIIDGKGNYKMTQDYQSWNGYEYNWNSYSMNVIPFFFNNCSNVYLGGFEIDGNFDQTTVDPGGIDQPHTSIGVFVHGTTNFTLANLNVHHWAEDGVYLGGGNIDRNGLIYQVDSHHNGRQGMSITNARGVTVVNSSFKDTGYAPLKRFPPGCGVDIEPDEDPIDQPNNRTGAILFVQNKYGNNWGGGGGGGGFEKGQPSICHYPGGLGGYIVFLPNNSPITLSQLITYPLNPPSGERTSDYTTFYFSQGSNDYNDGIYTAYAMYNLKLVSGNVKINVNTSGMRTIQYFLDGNPITGVVTAGSVTINTTQYTNGRHLLYAAATSSITGIKTNYDPIILIIINTSSLSPTPTPTRTPTPTLKPSPTPTKTPISTKTPTPIIPTPTNNPACVCQNDVCSSTGCIFDKFDDVTYASSIKCSLSISLFSTAPSAANKTSWCQATKRTKGDADGNGIINTTDYFYYLAVVSGGKIPVTVNPDFNGDGEVGAADRTIIINALKEEN